MNFIPLAIPDVVLIEPRVFEDERGFFMETWQRSKFAEAGIHVDGLIKDPLNYQGIDPADLGRVHQMVLGKHSGRAALKSRYVELGVELDDERSAEHAFAEVACGRHVVCPKPASGIRPDVEWVFVLVLYGSELAAHDGLELCVGYQRTLFHFRNNVGQLSAQMRPLERTVKLRRLNPCDVLRSEESFKHCKQNTLTIATWANEHHEFLLLAV